MKTVILCPSTQYANVYAYGNTSEGTTMQALAQIIKAMLEKYQVNVVVTPRDGDYISHCKIVNALSADLVISLHTNASPKHNAQGTEVLYNPNVSGAKQFAQRVLDKVVVLRPSKNRGVIDGSYPTGRNIGYINRITAKHCLLESEFHDMTDSAKWIIENLSRIAEAVTAAIVEELSLLPIAEPKKIYMTVFTNALPLWLTGGWNGSRPTTNIVRMPKGSKVEFIQRMNDKWYKVSFNGTIGYGSSQYLR